MDSESANRLIVAASLHRGVLLDLGAGTGRTAVALAQLGCDVIALDSSVSMLEKLRGKAESLRLRVMTGDASMLPFTSSTFDAVLIARLLYLIPISA